MLIRDNSWAGNVYISLVMATVGRHAEPEKFIKSLLRSNYNLDKIELVIIDQNDHKTLEQIIEKYRRNLRIIYIHIDRTGLSLARNMGVKYCTGHIIGFPDDDCEYFPDTLNSLEQAFQQLPAAHVVIGCVKNYDGQDVIRVWPKDITVINKYNFYTKYSSVGIFIKQELTATVEFCEQLGAGTKFGAAEDADYIYNLLDFAKVVFVPSIHVYHPDGDIVEYHKMISYGKGFGGFCQKNFDVIILTLFLAVLCYHLLYMVIAICTLKQDQIKYRWGCIISRVIGFFTWSASQSTITKRSRYG